ncbi:MAG: hypothetical protein PHP06_00725 [Clostridia bacterium]|nr:hypothetical protein [Clostridia bacterium]
MGRLERNKERKRKRRNFILGVILCISILVGGIGIINREVSKITNQQLDDSLINISKGSKYIYNLNLIGMNIKLDFKKIFEFIDSLKRLLNELSAVAPLGFYK